MHEVILPDDAFTDAQRVGILTPEESFALGQLLTTDDSIPEWLEPAVERLFLWGYEGTAQ